LFRLGGTSHWLAVNPFLVGADRYARGRPYHHARTLRRALGPRTPGRALDVACGTGLSLRGLLELGWTAYGVDAAPGMVAIARTAAVPPAAPSAPAASGPSAGAGPAVAPVGRGPAGGGGVGVVVGVAEGLPFRDGVFDLVTVSSGVHWFGTKFGSEAARVLRPGGELLLCEHAFGDAPGLREWFRTEHLPRYPAPPRGRMAAEADLGPAFVPVRTDRWTDPIPYDREGFADYLMTQSNVLASPEDPAVTRAWLLANLPPIFPTDITFTASYQLLRTA
jgi:SAM-dependent methyltransferase